MASLLTDQGAQFEARIMQNLYDHLGVRKIRTSPHHPRTDGSTERMNRSLIDMLRCVSSDNPNEWDRRLSAALFAYRSAVHSSTTFSPYELLFGSPPVVPGHLLLADLFESRRSEPSATRHLNQLRRRLIANWHAAGKHLDDARRRQKAYYDRFSNTRRFEENDLVWLRAPSRQGKLLPRYLGPFRVVFCFPNQVNYRIHRLRDGAEQVVNVERLKPASAPEPWMLRAPDSVISPPLPALPPPPRRSERLAARREAASSPTVYALNSSPAGTDIGQLLLLVVLTMVLFLMV